jgi:hypothetical protein
MKILKFDLLYPSAYFEQIKKRDQSIISSLSLQNYVQWIHEQQIGYGEVISHAFKLAGWEVFDFYNQDPLYRQKLQAETGIRPSFFQLLSSVKRRYFYHVSLQDFIAAINRKEARKQILNDVLVQEAIAYYKPDVIFLREPAQVNNRLFKELKKKHLIVTLIGCNIAHPINWNPLHSDLIFTIFKHYNTFFRINGIRSTMFEYGIAVQAYAQKAKNIDVSFVGLLGTNEQMQKTLLLESVAAKHPFQWWGPKGPLLDSFPHLTKTWQGVLAGKEMYEVYQRSKIVVNDYVDTANSDGVNMRIKEVMGTGSFLLTRFAENIRLLEEVNALKTFTTDTECSQLISHYLLHEEEREQIAATGYTYACNQFGSSTVMAPVITTIAEALEKKRTEIGLK